jgi:hypothetical protein
MEIQIGDCTIGVEETRATAEEVEKNAQVTDNDRGVGCRERKRRRRRGLVTIAY